MSSIASSYLFLRVYECLSAALVCLLWFFIQFTPLDVKVGLENAIEAWKLLWEEKVSEKRITVVPEEV